MKQSVAGKRLCREGRWERAPMLHESTKHWYRKRHAAPINWWTFLPECLIWPAGTKMPLPTWCLEETSGKWRMKCFVGGAMDIPHGYSCQASGPPYTARGTWQAKEQLKWWKANMPGSCLNFFLERFRNLHGAQDLTPALGNLNVSPRGPFKGLLFSHVALPCMQGFDLYFIPKEYEYLSWFSQCH